jgi:PAS domain S-box-containing protein
MTFDQATQRYFQLLEALDQAVIATDGAGRIMHWSSAASTLYGWTAAEVMGRDILEINVSEIARSQAEDIMKTLAAGEVWSGEFRVRIRNGDAFMASVTDVPLSGDVGGVTGIVGLSAPSHSPTDLVSLVNRFVAASNKVWPGRVRERIEMDRAIVPASEPHMIQLLSLLTLLYAGVMETGTSIEIFVGPIEESIFADFGLAGGPAAVYVRIARERRSEYSVLRNTLRTTEPTKYASALVRMVGGLLIAGAAPDELNALHLLLPAQIS